MLTRDGLSSQDPPVLIDSGLPLLRGLTVLAKQEPNQVLRGTTNSLADSVQGGSTFSESLAQHPRIFDKLYVNMVKAGELRGYSIGGKAQRMEADLPSAALV